MLIFDGDIAAARTRLLRERLNLSRHDLCARLGWTTAYLYRVEDGTRPFPITALDTVAHALGVSPRVLTGQAPLPEPSPAVSGSAIRAARTAQGLSLQGLLDRLHADTAAADRDRLPRSRQAIANIETGRTPIRPRYVQPFADALGVPVGALLTPNDQL